MGKTGGGIGTNQYGLKGVSQINRQSADVLDDIAEGSTYACKRDLVKLKDPHKRQECADSHDLAYAEGWYAGRDQQPPNADFGKQAAWSPECPASAESLQSSYNDGYADARANEEDD